MTVRAISASSGPGGSGATDADVARARALLARCTPGGPCQPALAGRLGHLQARRGADLHTLLACVDDTLVGAGRAPAAPHVACAALAAWAAERARLGLGADDPLTGLAGADQLRDQLAAAGGHGPQRVLVAEVMLDQAEQSARGSAGGVESELTLALVRAVLDDGIAPCAVWSRLGTHRLGAVVDDGGVAGLAASVGRARRWLARWRDDVDVAAWFEPVPTDPSARGALVRDLAM
ncbi:MULTISPECIES: hypothetical protein [unclassified Aeromicrobium]|uniref:hypothetical protein n=1 Tax=unclassified Aeromicrobium TaxID=2633570 RepID=UPI00288ABD23|nr:MULTISPECIES: hypothetical protein [unclassified Aeromicrobium]